jgi:BirA family biotin operon repressor/biotin-[acetyl-CoA-carboxylase] ligase
MMFNIRQISVTTSTNADAIKAAEAGEPEGLVIWALKQTAGRGRHGRTWESPEGNLFASILLRPGCDARHAGHYGFVAALAVRDTVIECLGFNKTGGVPLPLREGLGEGAKNLDPPPAKSKNLLRKSKILRPPPQGGRVTLKWPNDVLADGKKVSGILLEAAPVKNGTIDWLVIGIGINVEHEPENALYPATSLRAAGAAPPPLSDILDKLLGHLFRRKNVLENEGFAVLRAAWLEHAQKGKLSVRLPDRMMEGEFAGIGDNGNLVLQLADGTKQAIAVGDVFFGN